MSRNPILTHKKHLVSDPFHFLRQEFDRLFNSSPSIEGIQPEFEVKESKDCIKVTAELPGISEKDVEVSLVDNILTISGEKKAETTDESETYYIMERSYGSFTRSIQLPYAPDEKKISASFKDGVLSLTIPRPSQIKPNIHKILVHKEG